MKKIESIDDVFGTQEFMRSFKKEKGIRDNYVSNPYTPISTNQENGSQNNPVFNQYNKLGNEQNDALYLTITNTETGKKQLYVLNVQKVDEYNPKTIQFKAKMDNNFAKFDVDANYKKSA